MKVGCNRRALYLESNLYIVADPRVYDVVAVVEDGVALTDGGAKLKVDACAYLAR